MAIQESRAAALVWTNVVAGTGVTLSGVATANSGAISALQYERLGLFIAQVGAPTGTTPSLTITLQALDQDGNVYTLAAGTAITAAAVQEISVGPGLGATPNLFIPQLVQVQWAVTGTTPVFPNLQLNLYGR